MVSALSSVIQGLSASMRRMERAANSIVAAGLPQDPAAPGMRAADVAAPGGANDTDLPGAMVDILVAQRAFAAQLRVLRTADEMSRETVDLLKR